MLQEFLRGTAAVHALDQRTLQRLVLGEMEKFALSELLHVAVETGEEGLPFAVKLHFFSVEQRVIRPGLREELHDQRNGVHEHEEHREHEISHEGEGAALLAILEKLVQREGLREDVTPRLGADGGDAGFLVLHELADLGVEVFELEQQCVDLCFERFANGVLLRDELISLLLLHLLFEDLDAIFFGLQTGSILRGFGIESGIHAVFSGLDLGEQCHAVLRHRVEHAAETGALSTTPRELVFLNAFGTRAEADDAAALAVHFTLKLRLPVIELRGDLLVVGAHLGHLSIEGFELRFKLRGGLGDFGIAFALGLLFVLGERFLDRFAVLIEELRIEGGVPCLTLLRDLTFKRGDAGLDGHFLLLSGLTSGLDLLLTMLLDH